MATVHAVTTADGWAHQANQDDGGTSFGGWLRRAREARGLTLDDISRETKIPVRNLEAVEGGHLGVLPAFYQRAVVRAIAKAVGVDERLAIGRLAAVAPIETPPVAEVARPAMRVTVSTALVALALGGLIWTGAMRRTASESIDATATRQGPVTVALQPPVAESPSVLTAVSAGASAAVSLAASPVIPAPAIAASPEALTELVVRTEPPGAHVTVNGIGWGASPVTIRHLAPGEKHIRATKEGFGAADQVLALDDNERRELDLQLSAQ